MHAIVLRTVHVSSVSVCKVMRCCVQNSQWFLSHENRCSRPNIFYVISMVG